MNLSIRAIVFAIASFALTTSSFAAAPKEKLIYEGDIKAEQRIATATIADATNDLDHASKAFSRQTYKYAWVYLTDCGNKLDQTKSKLKDHPARIQVARQVFFNMNLSADARAKLSKSYYKIKEDLDHAYLLMNALESDLGKALGIDVSAIRKYMSALQILCEQTKEAKYCEAYAKLKSLVESGDIQGMINAIKDMKSLIEEVQGKSGETGIDVSSMSNVGTGSGSSASSGSNYSSMSPEMQSILSSVGNSPRASEYAQALSALDSAANSGDQNAISRRNALAKLNADCQRGVPGACDKLNSLLNKLADCLNGDPSACEQVDSIVQSVLNAGGSYGQDSGSRSASLPNTLTIDGKEYVVTNGKIIKTTYLGGEGQFLKKESVLKVIDYKSNPPVLQEVSSKDWNFAIRNSQTKATTTGSIYHFELIDQNGRDDFRAISWTVSGPDGFVQSGTDASFDVTFNKVGEYRVEIKGMTTELGSEFIVSSSVEVSF